MFLPTTETGSVPIDIQSDGRSRNATDYVVDAISKGIVDGVYRPGQRLIEADLTRDLGVGRSTIREALRRLEANRFVRVAPHRGAMVATPSGDEIEALFRVREVISGLGARAAAERIHLQGHRELMDELIEKIHEQIRADVPHFHNKENGYFHRTINNLSGIETVGQLMDQFNFPILHAIYFRDLSHEQWSLNMSDHFDMARAIRNGDTEAAEHFARRHMQRMTPIASRIAQQILDESS